jgi:hypothetical protein
VLLDLSFPLSLSLIHDDDLDDSFLSCDEWLEFFAIDWRLLGRRGGCFLDFRLLFHFFDVVQYNAQFSMPCKFVFLMIVVTRRVGIEY